MNTTENAVGTVAVKNEMVLTRPEGNVAIMDGKTVKTSNLKTGVSGERLQTLKEFKVGKKLANGEAKRAHREYLRENGVDAGQKAAALFAFGIRLPKGESFNPKTGTGCTRWTLASKLAEPVKVAEIAAAPAAPVDLLSILAQYGITKERFESMKTVTGPASDVSPVAEVKAA